MYVRSGQPEVQQAIQKRLVDTSKSVRQAVTELIGGYVVIRPEFLDHYYHHIAARLRDIGVSVRKQAVKIFRQICLDLFQDSKKVARLDTQQRYTDICVQLLMRISDEEETLRNLVTDTFEDMWFSCSPNSVIVDRVVVTGGSRARSATNTFTPVFRAVTQQLVLVVFTSLSPYIYIYS